jgi:small-conductance mechanosensitive channel
MEFSDILEKIKQLFEYKIFTINETPITISSLSLFIAIFTIWLIISKVVSKILGTKLLVKTRTEENTRHVIQKITQYGIIILGAIIAFQFIGIDLSGLAVVFGMLSVGIGFGLQNLTSNFISGLILLFGRPIRIGDRVTVGDTEGDVIDINIRATTINSLNNISMIVPNSEFISSTVINWSHGDRKIRVDIDVGVSYDSDLDLVLRSLQEVAEENKEVLRSPKADVLFCGFGDSSWDMQLRVWIADPKRNPQVRSDINCAIVRKFRESDIEIPFPQRDLHVRSPLPVPLSSGASG